MLWDVVRAIMQMLIIMSMFYIKMSYLGIDGLLVMAIIKDIVKKMVL